MFSLWKSSKEEAQEDRPTETGYISLDSIKESISQQITCCWFSLLTDDQANRRARHRVPVRYMVLWSVPTYSLSQPPIAPFITVHLGPGLFSFQNVQRMTFYCHISLVRNWLQVTFKDNGLTRRRILIRNEGSFYILQKQNQKGEICESRNLT